MTLKVHWEPITSIVVLLCVYAWWALLFQESDQIINQRIDDSCRTLEQFLTAAWLLNNSLLMIVFPTPPLHCHCRFCQFSTLKTTEKICCFFKRGRRQKSLSSNLEKLLRWHHNRNSLNLLWAWLGCLWFNEIPNRTRHLLTLKETKKSETKKMYLRTFDHKIS